MSLPRLSYTVYAVLYTLITISHFRGRVPANRLYNRWKRKGGDRHCFFSLYIQDDYLLLLITVLIITRLLVDEIFQPLEVNKFISFIDMTDLITAISLIKWWIELGSTTILLLQTKRLVNELAIPVLPTLMSSNRNKFG